jgi:hypothetical protein
MLTVDSFSLDASMISLTGKGRADLPEKTLDAAGTLVIANTSALPVRLAGTFDAPDYSFSSGESSENGSGGERKIDLTRQLKKLIGVER